MANYNTKTVLAKFPLLSNLKLGFILINLDFKLAMEHDNLRTENNLLTKFNVFSKLIIEKA